MLQNDYKKEFRRRMITHMSSKGHTISSLARAVEVDKSTISKLLNEELPFNPTIGTFFKIVKELEIPIADIVAGILNDKAIKRD